MTKKREKEILALKMQFAAIVVSLGLPTDVMQKAYNNFLFHESPSDDELSYESIAAQVTIQQFVDDGLLANHIAEIIGIMENVGHTPEQFVEYIRNTPILAEKDKQLVIGFIADEIRCGTLQFFDRADGELLGEFVISDCNHASVDKLEKRRSLVAFAGQMQEVFQKLQRSNIHVMLSFQPE